MNPTSAVSPSIFTLTGSRALSDFRLEKLRASLASLGHHVGAISAEFLHIISVSHTLTATELNTLQKLLSYGDAKLKVEQVQAVSAIIAPNTPSIVVFPRIGTISPWASKATDIAHNCGLDAIERIERATVFMIDGFATYSVATREAILSLLHDPMTESVSDNTASISELFLTLAPPPLTTISVINDGKAALTAANTALGLALSEDELTYLFDYYTRIKRDPTDVELMMFAQANSEHCRHKIFNASWTIDGVAKDKSLFAMIRHTHAISPQKNHCRVFG
ncbi:MAG: hypothetical protein HC782_05045 [Gammaproteobacteria bacterium]|nr:hypothetical protein [Gammaproteobacteria bacterium]